MAAFILKMLGLPVQVYSIGTSGQSGEGTNYTYPTSNIAQYPTNNNLYKYVNPILSSCCNSAMGLKAVNISEYVPILGEPGTDIAHSYYGYTDSFIHDDTYKSDGTSENVGYNTQSTSVYGNMGVKCDEHNVPIGCCYVDCCCSFDCLYSCVPKINEANIPYLHGELVKYGTLPWNVIESNVVCECGDNCKFCDFYTDTTNFDNMVSSGTLYSMMHARRYPGCACSYCSLDDKILCAELFGPLKISDGYGLARLGVYGGSCFDPTYTCTETIDGSTYRFCGCMHFDSQMPYVRGTQNYYFIAAKTCIDSEEQGTAFLGSIYVWNYQAGNLVCIDHAITVCRCVRYHNGNELPGTKCLTVIIGCYEDPMDNTRYICNNYVYIDVSQNSTGYPALCNITSEDLLDTMATQFIIDNNKNIYLANRNGDILSGGVCLRCVSHDAGKDAQFNENVYVINTPVTDGKQRN